MNHKSVLGRLTAMEREGIPVSSSRSKSLLSNRKFSNFEGFREEPTVGQDDRILTGWPSGVTKAMDDASATPIVNERGGPLSTVSLMYFQS